MYTYPTHIVAASGLISRTNGDILMVYSPRREWEIPGGQIEEGEDLIAGVMREIREETGVHVKIGAMTGVYSNISPPTKVIFNFLGEYVSGRLTPSPESPQVEWVPREEAVARTTHPALIDRTRDALAFSGQITYRVYSSRPYVVHKVTTL